MYAIKAGASGLEKSRSGIGPLSIFSEVEEINKSGSIELKSSCHS